MSCCSPTSRIAAVALCRQTPSDSRSPTGLHQHRSHRLAFAWKPMNLRAAITEPFPIPGRSAPGFTLTELLITIAAIAILCALLGPVLGAARLRAEQAKCLSNQHQLSVAFAAFILDNADQVPPNSSLEGPVASAKPPWVSGSSHNRQQHFTNSALLTRPDYAAFADYVSRSTNAPRTVLS
jgi:prepilin-type N-terminal cleavage/methylation domain-containing protein